jgi:hypothetical protein
MTTKKIHHTVIGISVELVTYMYGIILTCGKYDVLFGWSNVITRVLIMGRLKVQRERERERKWRCYRLV